MVGNSFALYSVVELLIVFIVIWKSIDDKNILMWIQLGNRCIHDLQSILNLCVLLSINLFKLWFLKFLRIHVLHLWTIKCCFFKHED